MEHTDRLAFDAIVTDQWTLVADFSTNRVAYHHIMLLTPVGDRVEFSFDGETAHVISRAEDQSLTFDERPIRNKLWARSSNPLGSNVAVNIW